MEIQSKYSPSPNHRRVTEIGLNDIQAFEGVGLFYPKLLRNKSPEQHVFKNFISAYDGVTAEGYVKMSEGIITGLYLDGIRISHIEAVGQIYHLFDRFNNPDEVDVKHKGVNSYSIRIWYD